MKKLKSKKEKRIKIDKENRVIPNDLSQKSFIVYSDNRNLGFKVNRIHRKILQLIKREYKDFIIHMGDFVFWDFGWRSFFRDLSVVGLKSLLFPVRGNHDNPIYFKRLFKMRSLDYSIEYDNMIIIILDDNANRLRKSQIQYVEKTLEKYKDKKWKLVILHKPLYSGSHGGVRYKIIKVLVPLFKKYHVQLCIGSHFHNYERLFVDGIRYVVSAGGGAMLSEQSLSPPGLEKHITTYHYLSLKVLRNQILIKVVDYNGKIIDEFQVFQK